MGEGEVSDGSCILNLHLREDRAQQSWSWTVTSNMCTNHCSKPLISEVAYENCHKMLKKCVPYSEYLGPNAFQIRGDLHLHNHEISQDGLNSKHEIQEGFMHTLKIPQR